MLLIVLIPLVSIITININTAIDLVYDIQSCIIISRESERKQKDYV